LSERDEKDTRDSPEPAESAVETAAGDEAAGDKAETASPPAGKKPAESGSKSKSRSGGSGLAWLALLLSLAALGLAGRLYWDARQQEGELESGLAAAVRASEDSARRLSGELDAARRQFREALQSQRAELEQAREARVRSLRSALESQRRQLREMSGTDRADWSLAEVEYLVRLAHQRLLMASDGASALTLLAGADAIVQELDDPSLHPVRAALASDMAALRGVAQVDVEGAWLRIRALAGQVDELPLFEIPALVVAREPPEPDADWKRRLGRSVNAALDKLSAYIVIRPRDRPYEPLLEPRWEQLVRQNLRLLLEQARVALLSGNELAYRDSIAAARSWLNEFFALNESAVTAMTKELDALAALDIRRRYPDIDDSLSAIGAALNSRHVEAGGN